MREVDATYVDTYTGKYRYRIENRIFRKPLVVLQLEVRGRRARNLYDLGVRLYEWWVDAGPTTLMQNEIPLEGEAICYE